MIITDKFVYIHMPKTGGTFVTQVLKQIHEKRGDKMLEYRADKKPKSRWSIRELFSPRSTFLMIQNWNPGDRAYNQHGRPSDIPPEHRHKPILTTLRNPFDRYVSGYEFKWWANHPPDPNSNAGKWLAQAYPHFPNLSFDEYVRMSNTLAVVNTFNTIEGNHKFTPETMPGRYTWQFIQFYFKNPAVIHEIDPQYMREKRYRSDLRQDITFLNTENLNAELYDFLQRMGYDPQEIDFIKTQGKIHPKEGGRADDQAWQPYYTPDLKEFVRQRECIIFDLFPVFDV